MMSDSTAVGRATFNSGANDYNAVSFQIEQALNRIRTSGPVRVVAVRNSGGDVVPGTVDVQPLVNQLDGEGNAVPHGILYGLPYFRYQAGANAIILDPQVGDIGIAGFCDRDISSVIANQAQANPGSARQWSMADGYYLGGILGKSAPTQFIAFSASGIAITSPQTVTITAPTINLHGQVQGSEGAVFQQDVVAAGISGQSHVHSGISRGSANTNPPVG